MKEETKTFFVEPTGGWMATFDDGRPDQEFPDEESARNSGWRSLAPTYRLPDGSTRTSSNLPPGSTFELADDWYPRGPDGKTVIVVLPNGHHWNVDSRASNCTLPEDKAHRCWCRHGDPRAANLTVDKKGLTCAAGAGSIWAGQGNPNDWHGFLWGGMLVREAGQEVPLPAPSPAPAPVAPAAPSPSIERVRFIPRGR